MDVRDLRFFIILGEELHFRRAAERLDITQQRLSQNVARLEAQTGLRLFDRTTRAVRLTAAGASFLAGAREAVAAIERSIQAARVVAEGRSGRIAVALSGFALEGSLPSLLRQFRDAAPTVELDFREMESGLQEDALERGIVDVGFAVLHPKKGGGLRYDGVTEDGFVLITGENDAAVPARDLRDFRRSPFVLTSRDVEPLIRDRTMEIFRDANIDPQIVQEVRQKIVLFGLIVAGVGVSIAPASVCTFQRSGIRYIRLQTPRTVSLVMISRIENPNPVVALLRDIMLQA